MDDEKNLKNFYMKSDKSDENKVHDSEQNEVRKYKSNSSPELGRYYKVIQVFYNIANLAGFTVESRIVLRSKKSGKIFGLTKDERTEFVRANS